MIRESARKTSSSSRHAGLVDWRPATFPCVPDAGIFGLIGFFILYVTKNGSPETRKKNVVTWLLPSYLQSFGRITSCPNNRQLQGRCDGKSTFDTSLCAPCPKQSCGLGKYFSSTCTCSNCTVQPMDCRTNSATQLFYAGCEGYGTMDNGACVTNNFDCGEECVEGITYQKVACFPSQGMRRRYFCLPFLQTYPLYVQEIDLVYTLYQVKFH